MNHLHQQPQVTWSILTTKVNVKNTFMSHINKKICLTFLLTLSWYIFTIWKSIVYYHLSRDGIYFDKITQQAYEVFRHITLWFTIFNIVTVRISTALILVCWFLLPLNTYICVKFYFLFRFILSLNISVFINWAWYITIVTVNERIYIMVVMQLSVSIDCPFLIATFSSIYTNLLH